MERVNVDGRAGVIVLTQDNLAPAVMMPLPDPTFFPNRFDDPAPGAVASTCNNVSNADTSSSCSLREAIRKANATAGTDTIMLAAVAASAFAFDHWLEPRICFIPRKMQYDTPKLPIKGWMTQAISSNKLARQ